MKIFFEDYCKILGEPKIQGQSYWCDEYIWELQGRIYFHAGFDSSSKERYGNIGFHYCPHYAYEVQDLLSGRVVKIEELFEIYEEQVILERMLFNLELFT